MSRRLDSTWTNWSEPENLGNLINTSHWDGYFTIPASGEYAYLSSEERAMGLEDIFRVKLFPSIKPEPVAIIKGIISNATDKMPVTSDAIVLILNDSYFNERIPLEIDSETGEYILVLPVGKTYKMIVSKAGYSDLNEMIDLLNEKSFVEIKKDIGLTPTK